MAATLANGGKNPVTGKQVMKSENVPEVLAVMATAGLYDDSGKWLYHTGLPAKSGVGGGLIAVSPGKFGIAVIAPPLDKAGNSVRRQKGYRRISNRAGRDPYEAKSLYGSKVPVLRATAIASSLRPLPSWPDTSPSTLSSWSRVLFATPV
jgi:glutaminase